MKHCNFFYIFTKSVSDILSIAYFVNKQSYLYAVYCKYSALVTELNM